MAPDCLLSIKKALHPIVLIRKKMQISICLNITMVFPKITYADSLFAIFNYEKQTWNIE